MVITDILAIAEDLPPDLFADCDALVRYIATKSIPLLIELSPQLKAVVEVCDSAAAIMQTEDCTERLVDLAAYLVVELLQSVGVWSYVQKICDMYAALPPEVRWLLGSGLTTVQAIISLDPQRMGQALNSIKGGVVALAARVTSTLVGVATGVKQAAGWLTSLIPVNGTALAQALLPGSKQLVEALDGVATKLVVDAPVEAIDTSLKLISGVLSADPEQIVAAGKEFISAVTDLTGTAFGALEGAAGALYDGLSDLAPW